MLLGVDGEGLRSFSGVLHGQCCAGSHRVGVAIAEVDRVTDLGAVAGELSIIFPVNGFDELRLLVEQPSCFTQKGCRRN